MIALAKESGGPAVSGPGSTTGLCQSRTLNKRIASLCAVFALLQAPAAAQFIAVTINGDFLRIEQNTGAASLLFSSGVGGMQGMTIAPNGRFWCIRRQSPLFPAVCQVDTVLNNATSTAAGGINDATGIAMSPSGYLYASTVVGGSNGSLYVIDLVTGPPQIVGLIRIGNQGLAVYSMTFAPNGTLYGWAGGYGLVRINPFTAEAVDVDGQVGNQENMQGLALAPDGFLYGGYTEFYRIDPNTGAVTMIAGSVGFSGFRGLEYYSFEPPTTYCDGKRNSAFCFPAIACQGSSSFSGPDDLTVRASNELSQKPGLLLWATAPQNVPFAGGRLCVSGAIHRTAAQSSGGVQTCDGTYSCNLTHAYMSAMGLQPGDWIYTQWWSRDQGFTAPNNVALTDALAIALLP